MDPEQIIECVKTTSSDLNWWKANENIANLEPHIWNRKVVQMGTADLAKDKLKEVRSNLGAADREDLISFADVIDFDERKIP